ncbi:MAG: F0F1 ATP synthase subunit B [Saprospiraceae bacterium]|jgi:F-type H+-transporting ATPase subunit b|nr:F0F1 ATP synthase subunit B [Saprospiraceae bacterium]
MIFSLLSFNPFQPTPGLAFWSLLIFVLFWVVMGKFAFKPIAQALAQRENDIQDAIDQAKKAREEMSNMKSENEKLLAQAREERAKILQEAKEIKAQMIAEARDKAREEANKIVANAMTDIENQKKAAVTEVKNQLGSMAISIAEKVIRKELKGNTEHEQFVNTLVKDLNLN